MDKKILATIIILGILVVAGIGFFALTMFAPPGAVRSAPPSCASESPVANSSYGFLTSSGCIQSNGQAYSYVVIDPTKAQSGSQFNISPSANYVGFNSGTVQVQVIIQQITQVGTDQGLQLKMTVPTYGDTVGFTNSVGQRISSCGQASIDTKHTIYLHACPFWNSDNTIRLYVYFGTDSTPTPPADTT